MQHLKLNTKIILIMVLAMFLFSTVAYSQQYVNNISKWDRKRPERSSTKWIVLHTTEGTGSSALNTVTKYGTCNYMVDEDGTVYIVISDKKVAKHAGRSMWYNYSDLSRYSVGIEVAGWHDKEPTEKQITALRKLIAYLKKKYRISDENVVTHSMVAYSNPNKWHKSKCRGRKRCGMLYGTAKIRKKLGLKNVFHIDPDVRARRLTIADIYLWKFLFGSKTPIEKVKPVIGKEDKDDEGDGKFEGFQEIGKESLSDIAGKEYKSPTTIYFFSTGTIRTGKELLKQKFNFKNIPDGTKVLVGYVYGGKVTKNRSAYKIAGKKRWNLPSTFYRLPDGTIKNGDDMDEDAFLEGTIVLFME